MIYIDDSEPEGALQPAFPYRDVAIKRNVDAYQLYDIISEIGRGKFGTVYKCQEKATGLRLAAKFVPIPKREDKRNVEREVEIMNSLQHHLITQLYAAYEYQKMMCVVLELIEGGELFDRVVDDEFVLTERVCVVFVRQLCEAMEFIHRNNILHLDLKPENVLCLTQEGNRIKIIDFGLARKYDPNKRLQILFGTPEFVAPEVVNFDCISYGTDMWSVGVICYVLISGLSPFMGETDIETMANVTIAKYDFEDEAFSNISPECLDFIGKLLVKDLSVRMTAAQCIKHKWLQPRPKAPPLLTQKSLNVLAPKLKASTPSPIPPNSDEEDFQEENEDDDVDVDVEEENVAGGFEHKELDSAKDNLRNFIERWEEHPNSPYVFDVEGNVIAPLSEATAQNYKDSLSSSRVCSPSPCESIASVADDDDVFLNNKVNIQDDDLHIPGTLATPINKSSEKLIPPTTKSETGASLRNTPSPSPTPTPAEFSTQYAPAHLFAGNNHPDLGAKLQQRSIKSYLHTFDRRNSDTNYLLGRRASGERINLADEIRKLSDHLLMLAEINTKFGSDTKKDRSKTNISIGSNDSNKNLHTKATTKTAAPTKSSKESAEVTSTSSKLNGGKTKRSTLAIQKLQQSIEETPKLANGSNFLPWKKPTTKSTISTISTSNANSTKSHSGESARKEQQTSSIRGTTKATASSTKSTAGESTAKTRRAKFRVTQMSRDVPIGLPDMHHPVNLEEAATTTKDCLLHLLEKYNETKCRNTLARHQSVSADWNMRDNLENRSMSSINAFFQRHNNTGEHIRKLRAQLHKKASGSFSK